MRSLALGLVQDGKVVFAGGFGVREFGKPEKVDADTLFRIASVTKPLSTLLLAKLVDDAVLTWDTPVTAVMPTFKLADPDATRHILVKHLFCACTGVPWRDYDVQFGFGHATPLTAIAKLATMAPLDAFGARFAYSNLLAAVGGFVAGHAFAPKLELGAAYDLAMAKRVFEPLAMRSTTFDTARALNSNHAGAYSLDIEGSTAPVDTAINGTLAAIRPAAGAWSNITDLLLYVQMELARGRLSDGRRYISEAALLARREPQIAVERGTDYGMALMTSRESGVTVIHHDGDAAGYHSKVLWLPDHQVGAVILATSDVGQLVRDQITRKLLEVLFDGMPLADARLARLMTEMRDGIATERRGLTIPAATDLAARLAPRYTSGNLGPLTVKREKGTTTFDFGDWRSEVVSWTGRDGTLAFVTIAPGLGSYVFTVGMRGDKRTLVLADHHDHTYTFIEDN